VCYLLHNINWIVTSKFTLSSCSWWDWGLLLLGRHATTWATLPSLVFLILDDNFNLHIWETIFKIIIFQVNLLIVLFYIKLFEDMLYGILSSPYERFDFCYLFYMSHLDLESFFFLFDAIYPFLLSYSMNITKSRNKNRLYKTLDSTMDWLNAILIITILNRKGLNIFYSVFRKI
jgi:hypothetical protein